jgi:hypothetical protein
MTSWEVVGASGANNESRHDFACAIYRSLMGGLRVHFTFEASYVRSTWYTSARLNSENPA